MCLAILLSSSSSDGSISNSIFSSLRFFAFIVFIFSAIFALPFTTAAVLFPFVVTLPAIDATLPLTDSRFLSKLLIGADNSAFCFKGAVSLSSTSLLNFTFVVRTLADSVSTSTGCSYIKQKHKQKN